MTKWIAFQYERLPKFCFNCGVIIHGKIGYNKKAMMRQTETTEYGYWLRAPCPTRRQERGPGKNGPMREMTHNYQDAREGAQSSAVARGGQFQVEGRGTDDCFLNPKQPKAHKERSEYIGINCGGVVENYLAEVQSVTDIFQTDAQNGRYDSRSQCDRRDLNQESESPPLCVSKKARFSPIKNEMRFFPIGL
jgi:hypothetical protein